MEEILNAAAQYPDSLPVRLHAAVFNLYGQTAGTDATAGEHIAAAEKLVSYRRDREFLDVIKAWQRHDFLNALERVEARVQSPSGTPSFRNVL
jgi:hypothetical protein